MTVAFPHELTLLETAWFCSIKWLASGEHSGNNLQFTRREAVIITRGWTCPPHLAWSLCSEDIFVLFFFYTDKINLKENGLIPIHTSEYFIMAMWKETSNALSVLREPVLQSRLCHESSNFFLN